MKTEDAIELFGNALGLANALGITRAAIYQWGENVPALRVYQIKEVIANRATDCPTQDAGYGPHEFGAGGI